MPSVIFRFATVPIFLFCAFIVRGVIVISVVAATIISPFFFVAVRVATVLKLPSLSSPAIASTSTFAGAPVFPSLLLFFWIIIVIVFQH